MCCLFTCFAWCIDAVQRAWVFAMSCCVCTAICTMLIICSVSGVALGYNYALAEYVELKETNISVFLKRGVFDDTVVDEMDWRRGGGGPAAIERAGRVAQAGNAAVGEDNVPMRRNIPANSPDEEGYSPPPGKKLDDSLVMSDNHRRFEGALMKLTGAAANLATTIGWEQMYSRSTHTDELSNEPNVPAMTTRKRMQDFYEENKDMQGLLNRKSLELFPTPTHGPPIPKTTPITIPDSPPLAESYARRMLTGFQGQSTRSISKQRILDQEFIMSLQRGPGGPGPGPHREGIVNQGFIPVAPMITSTEGFTPFLVDNYRRLAGQKLAEHEVPPAVIYDASATKRTVFGDVPEGARLFDKKPDEKQHDVDYDEDEIKGLPMRRKRDVIYQNSFTRTPKQISKETRPNTYQVFKIPFDGDDTRQQEYTLRGDKLEAMTIKAILRNLHTKSS